MTDKLFQQLQEATDILKKHYALSKDLYLTFSVDLYNCLTDEDRKNLYYHYQGINVYFFTKDSLYLLNKEGKLIYEKSINNLNYLQYN